ncbi:FHA domain-containing protein [Mycolicibacterium sp. XJ870]
MTDMDNQHASGEANADNTSMLTRAQLLNEPDAASPPDASTLENLSPGSALLVVKRGPNAGCQFRLDKPVASAGRHPDSDIFLDEITVSRKHAEFRWENDEVRVVDLGSLNGVYVNRERVASTTLLNGDELQLGKFRLVFVTRPLTSVGR